MKEQTIRRRLRVLGYTTRKSRARESIDNLGGYMLVQERGNFCVAGSRYDLEAADLAEFLKDMMAKTISRKKALA